MYEWQQCIFPSYACRFGGSFGISMDFLSAASKVSGHAALSEKKPLEAYAGRIYRRCFLGN